MVQTPGGTSRGVPGRGTPTGTRRLARDAGTGTSGTVRHRRGGETGTAKLIVVAAEKPGTAQFDQDIAQDDEQDYEHHRCDEI